MGGMDGSRGLNVSFFFKDIDYKGISKRTRKRKIFYRYGSIEGEIFDFI